MQGLPNFFGYYYLRNGKSYGFQIWPVHSEGPLEQKSSKNVGEKHWRIHAGTAQFFGYPLLSQEREKLQISNLASRLIQRVHTNKSPLKFWEKRERGRIHRLSNFIGYPLLSQARVKLRISNFACTFIAVSYTHLTLPTKRIV